MKEWREAGSLYVLEGREVVPCSDVDRWAAEYIGNRSTAHRIGFDTIGTVLVSTVFLGMDHNWRGGPPLLFETMTFADEFGEIQLRCSTYDQAEDQHKTVCRLVRASQELATERADHALERLRELAKKSDRVLDGFYKKSSSEI